MISIRDDITHCRQGQTCWLRHNLESESTCYGHYSVVLEGLWLMDGYWWRCTHVRSVCRLSVLQTVVFKWLQSAAWETDSFSASQVISPFLCDPKFIATSTTAPPPVPLLCHNNPVNSPSYLLRIPFNTTLPFNTRSSQWNFLRGFAT
jgi:hypothetical protein